MTETDKKSLIEFVDSEPYQVLVDEGAHPSRLVFCYKHPHLGKKLLDRIDRVHDPKHNRAFNLEVAKFVMEAGYFESAWVNGQVMSKAEVIDEYNSLQEESNQ